MNAWKITRPFLATGLFLARQAAYTIKRDDLPSLENQDPSGRFGDPSNPPLTIVYLGDSSITAPGVHPLDDAWPRQIALHLANRFSVNAISVAQGGAKARDVLASQLEQALELEPDIAYLSVGSNDALRGTPVTRFEAEYDRIVDRLHQNIPSIGLAGIGDLGTIPRFTEFTQGMARVRARAIDRAIGRVRAGYPRTIKSNAWNVMHTEFRNHPDMFASDLFHASAKGHLLLGELALPVADKLVEVWQAQTRHTDAVTDR